MFKKHMTDKEAKAALDEFDNEYLPDNYKDANGDIDWKAFSEEYDRAFFERFGEKPAKGENEIITKYREDILIGIYASERFDSNVKDFEKEKKLRELAKQCREDSELITSVYKKIFE